MTSGATFLITTAGSSLELPNDPNAQNEDFENFGDTILDFSETNPFGEPGGTYEQLTLSNYEPSAISLDNNILRFDENTATWDAR